MPDEDELEADRVEDVLLVETLMGWDGDWCDCDLCQCSRFRDGSDAWCPDCRAGRHLGEPRRAKG